MLCLRFLSTALRPTAAIPRNYHGDTFTGEVTTANDNEISLTYTNGKKSQTFVGKFEAGCRVPRSDSPGQRLTAKDFPKGTVLVAFYNAITTKTANSKSKENLIFVISFDVWQGRRIPDNRKIVYLCSNTSFRTFQVH